MQGLQNKSIDPKLQNTLGSENWKDGGFSSVVEFSVIFIILFIFS